MINKVQSQTLFSSAEYGLNRVFQMLQTDDKKGITKTSLSDVSNITSYDYPFAQLLTKNFTTLDENKDEVLSVDEFNKMMSSVQSKGLTQDQLLSLSAMQASSGTEETKNLLSTIIENFEKIDVNNDGCVSKDEVDAFVMDKEIKEKKEKLTEFKDTKITTFYASDDSTSNAINEALNDDYEE